MGPEFIDHHGELGALRALKGDAAVRYEAAVKGLRQGEDRVRALAVAEFKASAQPAAYKRWLKKAREAQDEEMFEEASLREV